MARSGPGHRRAHGAAEGAVTGPGRSEPAGLALFSAILLGWHLPAMFDATLTSEALHALEHTLFFAASVLLFKQLIPSPPLHASLGEAPRILLAVAAMVVSWVLAVVIALAPEPLYGFYAHLPSPAQWHLRAGRPADRRRDHVGAGLDHLRDRHLRLCPSLALAPATGAPAASRPRRLAGEH